MQCTTLGIDVAKNVFQLHGVDSYGQVTVQKRASRGKLLEFAKLVGVHGTLCAHDPLPFLPTVSYKARRVYEGAGCKALFRCCNSLIVINILRVRGNMVNHVG